MLQKKKQKWYGEEWVPILYSSLIDCFIWTGKCQQIWHNSLIKMNSHIIRSVASDHIVLERQWQTYLETTNSEKVVKFKHQNTIQWAERFKGRDRVYMQTSK